jgi:signal transduction histidine kinase
LRRFALSSDLVDDRDPNLDHAELYERAPCGLLTIGPDALIVRVNETFLTWTGHARGDVLGKRLGELLTVGGRVFLETHVAPLLTMQASAQEIALDFMRPHKDPLPVLINAVRRADALIDIAVFKVTDRRNYERELMIARRQAENAAQARADFVSMISHEIRTPLSAIIGIAHLLRKTELTPHQEKLTSVLRSSADNLLSLINDILDFSKIEAGKVKLEQRPVDLRQLVDELASTLRLKAQEKNVELQVAIDPAVPATVLADSVKIRQVLVNLVGNAIKFTAKGSVTIALTAERSGSLSVVRFEVRDTGIGIAADRIAGIFDDFTQASYEISVKYGGTGLGLAITRKILDLYKSRITVESTPGVGSTFRFALELPAVEDVSGAEPARPVESEAVRGMRVLLADDNEVNHFVLGGFLEKWGVVYDQAHNGRQAIEMIAANAYDVVLMDLRMPEASGYDVARAVRRMSGDAFKSLPIIAVSASMRMGDQEDLEGAGFTDFIGKPVAPEILLERLAHHRRSS